MKTRTVQTVASLLLATVFAAAANAATPQISVSATLNTPVVLVNQHDHAYLKVGLTGFEMESNERAPVNLALVIDRSGSMEGEKLARAKEAALLAVDRLAPDDLVSIVMYDTNVEVLVPATKASDRALIRQRIHGITAGGNTALFAGVSKGAAELRKFLNLDRVNRLILLSDGLANHGPSSPGELGDLGEALHAEGITVTTIGLGLDYNEDLMYTLARKAHGNHHFVEEAADLAKAFDREIGDVLVTVARNARVRISCEPGVRPVRLVGRDGAIHGRDVSVSMGNLYSEQEKYLILEVEVPAAEPATSRQVARVSVACDNLRTKAVERHARDVTVRVTTDPAEVERNMDRDTQIQVIRQIGNEQNEAAMKLRDEGKIEEAIPWFVDNAAELKEWSEKLDSPELRQDAISNAWDADNMAEGKYERQRKIMRERQNFYGAQEGAQGVLVPQRP